MDKVRLGVIGCGSMAQNHMQAIAEIADLHFIAAADPVEATRQMVAEKFNVKTFADGYEMIASGEIDAVFIGTPHYFHPTYTIAALEHGLHVLSEKPLAVTAKAAQTMIDAANKHPTLVFAVMFQMRTAPIWKEAKRLIDAGELGPILRANWMVTTWFRSQAYYNSGGWRATWKGEGGGVLLNQCPHNLDLFTWLVGSPTQVQAMVGLGKHHQIEVEDDVTAMMRFENGATGTFVTNTAEAPGVNRLEIVGDQSTLIISPDENRIELLRNNVLVSDYLRHTTVRMGGPAYSRHVITPGGKDPGYAAVHENFAAAILRGEPLIAPGAEGIAGLELGNAILQSGLENRPIDLPTDRDAYDQLIQNLIQQAEAGKLKARKPITAGT